MTYRSFTFVLCCTATAAFAPGCASSGNKNVAEQATEAAAEMLLPVSEENKLGEQMSAELAKELTLHPDPEVQAYVRALGAQVVAAANDVPEGITFTFHVVKDDETVNAFAIPGGHIYIYTGLMRLAEDEAELVSVLGHEVAHVTKRHIAQRLVGAYGYTTLLQLALGEEPGLLGEIVGGVVTNGLMLKHGRDHERHADTHGIRYTVGAGYDPHGFVRMFERMKSAGDMEALEIFMTHPLPQERADRIALVLTQQKSPPTKRNAEPYAAMKAKL
jgi:predicted Zn-dependent protease